MKLQKLLENHFNTVVEIRKKTPVSGGSINRTYVIETSEGNYFVKENNATKYPEMFEKEAKGLNLIASTNNILTPEIITYGNHENTSFLILEQIQIGNKTLKSWTSLGSGLAKLHQNTNEKFGLDYNNYIGSLQQLNNPENSWEDFYTNQRIKPMVKMAIDKGLFSLDVLKHFDSFYDELPSIFPKEPPALLHGDLWSGNFMIDYHEQAILIDPAVYYGHREMDVGMSLLFGGFDDVFYSSYNDVFPLEKEWKRRVPITQLYPLLVHVNLFGGGYVNSVLDIIRKF